MLIVDAGGALVRVRCYFAEVPQARSRPAAAEAMV
jgi:hypothetical protein